MATHKEWAVQTKEYFDGDWDRIDNGHRMGHSVGFTEAEARDVAGRRTSNGLEPSSWKRVVSREVTDWEPEVPE